MMVDLQGLGRRDDIWLRIRHEKRVARVWKVAATIDLEGSAWD